MYLYSLEERVKITCNDNDVLIGTLYSHDSVILELKNVAWYKANKSMIEYEESLYVYKDEIKVIEFL